MRKATSWKAASFYSLCKGDVMHAAWKVHSAKAAASGLFGLSAKQVCFLPTQVGVHCLQSRLLMHVAQQCLSDTEGMHLYETASTRHHEMRLLCIKEAQVLDRGVPGATLVVQLQVLYSFLLLLMSCRGRDELNCRRLRHTSSD